MKNLSFIPRLKPIHLINTPSQLKDLVVIHIIAPPTLSHPMTPLAKPSNPGIWNRENPSKPLTNLRILEDSSRHSGLALCYDLCIKHSGIICSLSSEKIVVGVTVDKAMRRWP
jgi:hypothetical protein